VSGDQFQTWRTRAKPFVEKYNVIQQAMAWETTHADQMVVDAASTTVDAAASRLP
jgi:hypothetical protein